MTFYTLFIGLETLLLGEFKYPNKRFATVLGITLLVLVSVLRFDVGFDYISYHHIFYPTFDRIEFERLEPISQLFFYIGYKADYPPLTFAFYACITYMFIIKSLRKFSCNFSISILCYLFLFYLSSFGIIRQALAVAITFWGFRFVKEKQFCKYVLVCVTAFLVHKLGILAVLVYPLYHWCSWKLLIVAMAVAYVYFKPFVEAYTEIDGTLYSGYLTHMETFEERGGSKIMYFYLLLVLGLAIIAWLWRCDHDKRLLPVIMMGVFCPFVLGGHLGTRVSEFFTIFVCIWAAQIMSGLHIRTKCSFVICLAVYFMLIIHISEITNANGRAPFTPYRTILFRDLKHSILRN